VTETSITIVAVQNRHSLPFIFLILITQDSCLSPQHEYDDIIKWYEELTSQYSEIATYYPTIGKSYEGRDMPAVHITANTSPDVLKIYFQCQSHASKLFKCYTMAVRDFSDAYTRTQGLRPENMGVYI